jgi:hypothetical protein
MIPKQWMLGTNEHHEGGDHWREQKKRRGGKEGRFRNESEEFRRSENVESKVNTAKMKEVTGRVSAGMIMWQDRTRQDKTRQDKRR